MRYLFFANIFCLLLSCDQSSESENSVSKFEKALLRSRVVNQVKSNIDKYNDLEIIFNLNFASQLVELDFKAKKMNSTVLTGINQDREEINLKNVSSDGAVDILLNGQSIKSCLVAECIATKCTNEVSDNLSGLFSTHHIYLNLQKIKANGCNTLNLINGVNTIVFRHIDDQSGGMYQGLGIEARITSYNLSWNPEGVDDVFN